MKYLVAGLGNPGRSHRFNRHNVGFMVVSQLAERHGLDQTRRQKRATITAGLIAERSVILARPQTYMNLSGEAIAPLVSYYDIPLENLLVIYDEIDLPLGTLRLREKGGSGGHNGMKSIIKHLGQEFPRMRLGIGRPPGRMEPAAYVLRDFRQEERLIVAEMIDLASAAVESFLSNGIELAMTRFNGNVLES